MNHTRDSAFRRFMQIVTDGFAPEEPRPDPDDMRISQLEAQVRAIRRSMGRSANKKKPGPRQGTRSPGSA
jgi:hypothetical protein